jgi:histidyl-tRNA synthetase
LEAKFVLIMGDAELQTGKYQLKRMSDGEQVEASEAEIIKKLGG